ncbi:hypothetical protein [Flavobacterium sp.]|uniref:hypothetical protein n=1 Tax=Flavobacterium sp. TaxID=239 RepID=UPI0031D0F50A
MKIILKSLAICSLFFIALSCTENEDSQQAPTSKTTTVKKLEETKTLNASAEEDDEAHPKRKTP